MLKSFVQGLGALCLFLAVLLFPTKIGLIITEIVQACWNIVVTVGRNVRVPGEQSNGVILLGVGMLVAPGAVYRLASPRTHLMKTLLSLPTRLTAQAHASAVSLEAGSTRLSRAQVGSALLLGLMVLMASDASAASAVDANGGIVTLIKKATNFLLLILAAAVVGMASWGAFLYVTSAGNNKRVDMAKDTIKNVFIGLAVAAAVFLLRQVVLDLIGGVDSSSGGKDIRKNFQGGL
jgi:Type IV secretion system pilin